MTILLLMLTPLLVAVGRWIARWNLSRMPVQGLVLLVAFFVVGCVLTGLVSDKSSSHRMFGHGLLAFSYLSVPLATGFVLRGKSSLAGVGHVMVGATLLTIILLATITGYLPNDAGSESANRFFVLHQVLLPLVMAVCVWQLLRSVFKSSGAFPASGEPLRQFVGDSPSSSNPYEPPRS